MRGRSPAAQRVEGDRLGRAGVVEGDLPGPAGGEQPLGAQAHDGVRALLQVARSHVDVDDGDMHVLAGLRRSGMEQHRRARRL